MSPRNMKNRRSDFPPGTRAIYYPSDQGFECAGLGAIPLVVHLNSRLFITGTVLEGLPKYFHDEVYFRPDGWPLPDGVAPQGFAVTVFSLEKYQGEEQHIPAIKTPGNKPVSKTEVVRLVNEYLKRK